MHFMYDYDLGLKCKCLTVTDITNDLITDYPTVSSRVLKTKKCESCDKKACKYCVKCEQLFCKSCVKVIMIVSSNFKKVLKFR